MEKGKTYSFDKMIKIKSLTGILVLMFIMQYTGSGQEKGCWGIFRGSQRLTGTISANLPDQPRLLWKFSTGEMIKSSPVVCQNKLVIGSADGTVWCLDLSGKEIWHTKTSNGSELNLLLDNRYISETLRNFVCVGSENGNNLKYKTKTRSWISQLVCFGETTFWLLEAMIIFYGVDAAAGKAEVEVRI